MAMRVSGINSGLDTDSIVHKKDNIIRHNQGNCHCKQ